jgi:hypothetical protein
MTLNDAALVDAANGIKAGITHVQLHSTNVGGAWGSNAVGSRVAVTPTVDADGDITITGSVTGLTANQAIGGASYWNQASGGVNKGGTALTGDATANAAGEYSFTITENGTAS